MSATQLSSRKSTSKLILGVHSVDRFAPLSNIRKSQVGAAQQFAQFWLPKSLQLKGMVAVDRPTVSALIQEIALVTHNEHKWL